ncbi:MAG: hypothetical protein ACFB11_21730 [Paracoccaceae bacterium]
MNEAIDQPVIVILHHLAPPLRISDDKAALQEPDALIDLLAADRDVRQVISGHIHMTFTTLHRGIPFTTTTVTARPCPRALAARRSKTGAKARR